MFLSLIDKGKRWENYLIQLVGVRTPLRGARYIRKNLPSRFLGGIAPPTFPGASRIAPGRIQHYVLGEKKPARVEVRSRQMEASRLRKPLVRLTTEGVTHVLNKKGA